MTSSIDQEIKEEPLQGAQDDPWVSFLAPKSSHEYFCAWLDVVCAQASSTKAAALLLRDPDAGQLLPIATWPRQATDLARLGALVEKAIAQKRGVLVPGPGIWQIGYPIFVEDTIAGAVVLELAGSEGEARAILRYLHWGLGWIVESLGRRDQSISVVRAERLGAIMEAVASALRPVPLRELLNAIVGETALRLGCARAAIGLAEHDAVQVEAISDIAWIEKNGALAVRYRRVMEEAMDAGQLLRHPSSTDSSGESLAAHEAFISAQGATSVVSCPLMVGLRCVAVLTLEWQGEERTSTDEDILWLQAYAALVGSVIEDRRLAAQGALPRMYSSVKALGVRLFGPRHLIWKAGASALILLTAALALIPVDYRVAGKTVIEGATVRTLGAPFDGFIALSHARAGDVVEENQLLAELDDKDLKVELAKAMGERDQHERKLREMLATRDMGGVQIAEAQVRQADAQASLVSEKIARARIVAPFSGTLVSGDLSQLTGSPVELGKKLFEVAPLEGYRVIVQVDERDVRYVQAGQPGKLLVAGIAAESLPFTVTRVTSVATAQDGKNTFRVEAKLDEASGRLRPGMEGVGKIVTAEHSLWWVLTHSMTDWLRLQLWTWLP